MNALVVPDDIDFGNLQHNAKFLIDEELDRSRDDVDCLMAQGLVMMFRTVLILLFSYLPRIIGPALQLRYFTSW